MSARVDVYTPNGMRTISRTEWLAARKSSWLRSQRLYWVLCCQYAVDHVVLNERERTVASKVMNALRVFQTYEGATDLKAVRPLLRKELASPWTPLHYFWKGLLTATTLMKGGVRGVSNLDLVDLAECFDDGSEPEAYRLAKDFQTEAIRCAFQPYDEQFHGSWREYKASTRNPQHCGDAKATCWPLCPYHEASIERERVREQAMSAEWTQREQQEGWVG